MCYYNYCNENIYELRGDLKKPLSLTPGLERPTWGVLGEAIGVLHVVVTRFVYVTLNIVRAICISFSREFSSKMGQGHFYRLTVL